jgi:beta-lactamase superfamily II metal-dependent hydrolase
VAAGVAPPRSNAGDPAAARCGGAPLSVTFYDAGQALAALVTLPDGRHILVDAGEDPQRAGCGAVCRGWHARVVAGVTADLHGDALDLVWITHPHSDHHGGLPGLAANVDIRHYVDNGQAPQTAGVQRARAAARQAGATLSVVEPGHTQIPLPNSDQVQLRAVVPDKWPVRCERHPNDCSIGLMVTYCASTVLMVGDAEAACEGAWDVGDVDLLQVGHHGGDTSSTAQFIDRVRPEYAVISSADRGEGTNRTYCHPRKATVERLTAMTGGPGSGEVAAYDSERPCTKGLDDNWDSTATSDHLWLTSRDGTVTLQTTGDGTFVRIARRDAPASAAPVVAPPEPTAAERQTIRAQLVQESRDAYDGACPCPESVMSNGRRCGARSAYSRGGGDAPLCYPRDVTDEMVNAAAER